MSTPPWRTAVPDLIALCRKQSSNISLGTQTRVSIDMAGWAPILLDRWEFEALGGKSKESDYFRRAVALRALATELRLAVEARENIDPSDIDHLAPTIRETFHQAHEVNGFLTRLAENPADAAHQRRYLLTRDNMIKALEALSQACTQHGISVDVTPPVAAAAPPPKRASAAVPRSSVSGAFGPKEAPPPPKNRMPLLVGLVVAAVAIAVFNLWPQPDPRKVIEPGPYADVIPVADLWLKGGVVSGTVTDSWFRMSEADQQERMRQAFQRLSHDYGAERVALYQPGGQILAAVTDGTNVEIKRRSY